MAVLCRNAGCVMGVASLIVRLEEDYHWNMTLRYSS